MEAGRELDILIADTFKLPPRRYSTDIAAAWLVVEHMITIGLDDNDEVVWERFSKHLENYGVLHGVFAPKAAEWICRAALQSVGGAVPDVGYKEFYGLHTFPLDGTDN